MSERKSSTMWSSSGLITIVVMTLLFIASEMGDKPITHAVADSTAPADTNAAAATTKVDIALQPPTPQPLSASRPPVSGCAEGAEQPPAVGLDVPPTDTGGGGGGACRRPSIGPVTPEGGGLESDSSMVFVSSTAIGLSGLTDPTGATLASEEDSISDIDASPTNSENSNSAADHGYVSYRSTHYEAL